jgi:predicted metal-binding membrane protein
MTVRSASTRSTTGSSHAADARGVAFRALMGALVVAAWLMLWLWSASPYGRYLDHGRWTDAGVLAAICRAVPEGDIVVPALLYAAGWVLMIAAMMLPTTLPILEMFRRMTASRPDGGRLLGLAVAGYIGAWLAFGLAAHVLDWTIHALAERAPWLALNGWVIGVAVLGTAGLFQFSALKYRCLDKCHTPLAFIIERWHGRRPRREALALGFEHGVFCVGCCWALMLLMFVVGTGSLAWMLGLAAVMAAEKNLPGGRRLRTPLGVALIAGAVAILAVHAGSIVG